MALYCTKVLLEKLSIIFVIRASMDGWAGNYIPRLFWEAGLVSIQVTPLTAPITDLSFVQAGYLDKAVRLSVNSGVVTPKEGSNWMLESELMRQVNSLAHWLCIVFKGINHRCDKQLLFDVHFCNGWSDRSCLKFKKSIVRCQNKSSRGRNWKSYKLQLAREVIQSKKSYLIQIVP